MFGSVSVRQVKFSSAIEADLVRPLLDCEDAAQVMVTAAKDELNYTPQTVHRLGSRRRWQIAFAPTQLGRMRTLLRAKAIAQSSARWQMKVGFQDEYVRVLVKSWTGMMLHPNLWHSILPEDASLLTLVSTCWGRNDDQK